MSLPTQMRVIEMCEFGGPNVLIEGRRDLPEVSDDQVLIKVKAAGVNGPDLLQRRGHYPPPKGASDLLGLEVSGEIVALGRDQTRWSIGDRACALANGGGYAEYVAVNARHCLPIPDGVNEKDAAGLPETYFTVWSNIFFNQKIKDDSVFLVHGGSGGIGSTAIQIGAAMGLKVFATAGSSDSCTYCEELGAHQSINFNAEDFVPILREIGGANIILDIIGGDYVARNIKAAHADAKIIQLAFNLGSKIEVDLMPVMLKRLTLTGSTLRSRSEDFKSEVATDLIRTVWPLFGSSPPKLRTTTFAYFDLADANKAHTLMESGSKRGKILLTM
ncbi:NAD(P)H-quinone oxidoreductase [Candidatus Puniceispirillum sp.]|nr:NAD(P)H-quinone oxidoreductase [Candidatus Puniceispirillum sp.]